METKTTKNLLMGCIVTVSLGLLSVNPCFADAWDVVCMDNEDERSPLRANAHVCVAWGFPTAPIEEYDFDVDYECTGCATAPRVELATACSGDPSESWYVWSAGILQTFPPSASSIGELKIGDDPDDYVVKIYNLDLSIPGAANLGSAVLEPDDAGDYSSIASGSRISGDLLGALTVVEDSSNNGSELNLVIDGDADGDITAYKLMDLDITGSAGGLISAYDVIAFLVGENLTGQLETDFISGTAEITGNCPGDIEVFDELSGGTLEVGGSVTSTSTIDIADMVTDGTGSSLKFNTTSGDFEGKLFLETGVPAGQEVVINGALDGGWVDLNALGVGVGGHLYVYGGGTEDIGAVDGSAHGGSVAGTVVLGKDGDVYTGTATFTSVSSSGTIKTDDSDFDGTLTITGNMSGSVHVDGDTAADGDLGGSISVGGEVAAIKEILIDGDVENGAGITVTGDVIGDIDMDGQLLGDVSVGADVNGIISVAGDVTSTGSIDVTTGDLDGSIVVGTQGTNADLDGDIHVYVDITDDGYIDIWGDVQGNGSITVDGDAIADSPPAIYIDGTVLENGDIDVGNLTGKLQILSAVSDLGGDITFGILAGTFDVVGAFQDPATLLGTANVVVTDKIYGTTWHFLGPVAADAYIEINDMESNGATDSVVKFGGPDEAFAGDLKLVNGIPADQSVEFYGAMNGEVDLNSGDVDGTLDLDDGGSGDIISGGTVNSTTVYLGSEGHPYSGEATFAGVASGKRVWTRRGNLSGTIDITGSLAGKVAVGEALQAGGNVTGNILVGVDVLSTGFIEVIGYMDGLIDVDGDVVEDGTIDVGEDMDGLIDIGGDFDGDIVVGGNMTGGDHTDEDCDPPGIYVYGDVRCGMIDIDGSMVNGAIHLDTGTDVDQAFYNGDICASNLSAGQLLPDNICIDEIGLDGEDL